MKPGMMWWADGDVSLADNITAGVERACELVNAQPPDTVFVSPKRYADAPEYVTVRGHKVWIEPQSGLKENYIWIPFGELEDA